MRSRLILVAVAVLAVLGIAFVATTTSPAPARDKSPVTAVRSDDPWNCLTCM
ncbi:hypothetical protein GCM10010435_57460 [Winogradskya consettensis]|uniref:Uncharacterized protein n=2 Tax=Winogradskya consettensis TaxID=113560 RepID=A0A919S7K1_9ACTN|nr:hypothetical protein Aco04nite_04860 [Actinoplanes consettensis]